jgi:purine-binding chemotaxis protein CheW
MEAAENRSAENQIKSSSGREGKYLTFSLSGEEYGIGIRKVREIIGMMTVTHVPQTPYYIKGVINLRGKVIPIIDLRLKFAMEAMDYTERTCIIVVEITEGGKMIAMGLVVDSVSEVVNIREGDVDDTPAFGNAIDTDYILGMAKVGGNVKILLDIDRVFATEEIADMNKAIS